MTDAGEMISIMQERDSGSARNLVSNIGVSTAPCILPAPKQRLRSSFFVPKFGQKWRDTKLVDGKVYE